MHIQVDQLCEMFPSVPPDSVQQTLKLACEDVDKAVDQLLTTEPDYVVVSDDEKPTSLKELLKGHAKQNNLVEEYRLSVDRSTPESLWQVVVSFYKSCKFKPYKLRQELVVDFSGTGEIGADCGALRREFFEDSIIQANLHLLEGESERRVVKKDWGMELEYECFGMLVAHSILQGGPGVPCFCSSMFDYLSGQDVYPVKQDIPLHAGTHHLISFIEEVSFALVVVSYVYDHALYFNQSTP